MRCMNIHDGVAAACTWVITRDSVRQVLLLADATVDEFFISSSAGIDEKTKSVCKYHYSNSVSYTLVFLV